MFERTSFKGASFKMGKDGGTVEFPTERPDQIDEQQNSSLASVANSTADLIPHEQGSQPAVEKTFVSSGIYEFFVVGLMTVINLLNYIDRYTLASQ